ncbi:hypothetical protein [Sulfurovum sp.]|uniref:hypothetical protein n=1 Tax=Sulfurovum sp. TaxID=1969726 RepID=UPI0025FB6A16|nr:hypothetical protein [Sulfurovum sp.]
MGYFPWRKISIYLLWMMIFSAWLQASEIKVSEFHTSRSVDSNKSKAVGVATTFDTGIRRIYASAKVYNIFPPTQFTVKWYYYNGQHKEVLYRYKTTISGSRFIYSAIVIPKDTPLSEGKYFVAISALGHVIARTSFNILSSKTKSQATKGECIKPTSADNELLIKDMLAQVPLPKDVLSAMRLRRFHDRQKRFSLLAPSGWVSKKRLAQGEFLHLADPPKGAVTVYMLLEIPIDKSFIKKHSLQESVLVAAELIKKDLLSKGGKIVLEPKVYAMPDLMAGRIMFHHSKGRVDIFELHTLIFDGKYMYDVVLVTNKEGLEVSKFLSLLASYSFWTVESCPK